MQLNPIWLNTFKTLVEKRHFTHTAEKLHMTQPGVSQHIRKLEDACGYPLIKRKKKSFEVSHQGELLYDYIISLHNNEARLAESFAQDDANKGICRIAATESITMTLYPKLLEALHTSEVNVQMEAATNHCILAQINSGQTDIGLVTDKPNSSEYSSKVVGREELVIVLPANVSIDINQIARELCSLGLIRHPNIDRYLGLILSCEQNPPLAGVDVRQMPEKGYVNRLQHGLEAVSQGVGFTVLPRSCIHFFHSPNNLAILALECPIYETLYLTKKANRELPVRFKGIIKYIRQLFINSC